MKKSSPFTTSRSRRALLAFSLLIASGTACAQGYPDRPLRIIVPQAAGGGLDIVVRALAGKLTETWGQQIVVDNRPGANGIIGMEQIAKAKPDGYTIGAGFTSVLTVNSSVYKSLPYDTLRDFAPITQLVANTIVLVVNPHLPARSVKELVALGRSRPGDLAYGSFGIGNLTHLAGELLGIEARLKMIHVPYKGETPAVTDLIAGQVALGFTTAPGAAAHIKSGALRLLATCGEKRAIAYPGTPTMIEAGFPKFVVAGWGALVAPVGTTQEIIQKVSRDSARHMMSPELRERLSAIGAEPVASTPEQIAAFMKSETQKWLMVVKAAGIYKSQ
jgi:tripartite-type tricarboxylate transporter receptor subunit TctC